MQKSLAKWWSSACQITIGLDKIIPRVARVLKIIVRVGSGWPKRPRVGSNLGSGFDPTHPYIMQFLQFFKIFVVKSLHNVEATDFFISQN